MNSEWEIRTLLYKYSWLLDNGKIDEMADLFEDADILVNGKLVYSKDKKAFARGFHDFDQIHDDGTLKTMHLVINPIISVDEEADTATAEHYTVVIQGITAQFSPQIIVMDQKFDTFKRVDGVWKFASRNMINRAIGDLSHHGKYAWAGAGADGVDERRRR